jgi:predicted Rossmann fold nucleotide-binding protein DprA/Smf involved in DNA uptake
MVDEGGALLSEYPPGTPPQRFHFVERDRIQAGLADAVLVVESGVEGGSMHTVKFAKAAGIPVWVTFPDDKTVIAEDNAALLPKTQQGTWYLFKSGALRVGTPRMLLDTLESLEYIRAKAAASVSGVEQRLFQ